MSSALVFEVEPPVEAPAPNRMDVACFVGWVALRRPGTPVSPALADWLAERGWPDARPGRHPAGRRLRTIPERAEAELRNVPVPVESWAAFDAVFAWERRPVEGSRAEAITYLGAAVRSFFGEGGRRCYVVRLGDPWPLLPDAGVPADAAERAARRTDRLRALVPGFPARLAASPADRESWLGVAHLFGLPDVSFLCCPDLADAVRGPGPRPGARAAAPAIPEQFVPCDADATAAPAESGVRHLRAPRCDEDGYAAWARAVTLVREAIVERRGVEAQLLAALPIPAPGLPGGRALRARVAALGDGTAGEVARRERETGAREGSFVQLAYPWVRTRASADALPEGLESPDAVLAGVLARNALERGAYRSAAGLPLATVTETVPPLPQEETVTSPAPAPRRPGGEPADAAVPRTLAERVSLLGRTPRGMRLLSDATAGAAERYRPGAVHRLVAAIVRAAGRAGEDAVFESSGPGLWARVAAQLDGVMLALWRDGALRGEEPGDAFDVRCDRTTVTQADLDAGRVVAQLRFDPAAPIERITVALSLDAAGASAAPPALSSGSATVPEGVA